MRNENFREFAKYASLNTLGMVGLSLYILADTFFISKGLGANGLTALNLALPIYNLVHGAGLMLGMGGATRYSIVVSRGDRERGAMKLYRHHDADGGFFVGFLWRWDCFFPDRSRHC